MTDLVVKEWQEILEIRNGRDYKKVKDENGIYPIYGSGGIMGYANDYICPSDTVIIGRKGNINKPIYVNTEFWNVDTAFGLVPNKDYLNPKYLYYFCVNFNFEKLNTTVTIPSLTKSNLQKLKMSIPPLDVQKHIVDLLDKSQEIIATQKKQLEELDKLIKSIFYNMFGDPSLNNMGWSLTTIEHITEFVTYGLTVRPEYVENGIPLISAREIRTGKIDYSSAPKILKEDFDKLTDKSKPNIGDILFSKTGTIGYSALIEDDFKFAITQNVARIVLKQNSNINGKWLLYYLRTPFLQSKARNEAKGNAVKDLQIRVIKSFKVPIPSLELQNKFVQIVNKIEGKKYIVNQSIKESETLFNSLMSNYFNE